jgi:hypothetical protein
MREVKADVAVIGGGLGGVAAALTAASLGNSVILTEETDWLGGQITSQAVPPDEHPWVETLAASRSYRSLRERIRDYYRRNYPLRPELRHDPLLNPGLGRVSAICHEPPVAVAAFDEMLAPLRASGRLRVLPEHQPVQVSCAGDRVDAVTLLDRRSGDEVAIEAQYIIDATELGDLLELGGVEHVIGSEARSETGELHALDVADPLDQQAITWCYPVEYRPGEEHVIDKPADYDYWLHKADPFWPGPQLSWTDVHPVSLQVRYRPIFWEPSKLIEGSDLWHYRQIFDHTQYVEGAFDTDVTLVNWPQTDYWDAPLVGVDEAAKQKALEGSRQLSLSFLYWMQTEAPRRDGGTGYAGLRLRPDLVGTSDGLAKAPYIRESRRIRAEFTVLEQHVGVEARAGLDTAEAFSDSIGIGYYRIDLHPSTGRRTYIDARPYPFQIPLGAVLPVRVDNLLPANKNIGTTHITNGCYRLHPVEWAIGEGVGALVAFCLKRGLPPRAVRADGAQLADYQRLLAQTLAVALEWPEHVRHYTPAE